VFNLSGSEIVFLLIAGLVVLGPERLPGVIRTVGRIYGDIRRAAKGLEKELTETFKEPIADFKAVQKDLTVGFGEIDTEPSPPMRPEKALPLPPESSDPGVDAHPSTPDKEGDAT
jgi:sec-independent protein translocase protein TatB